MLFAGLSGLLAWAVARLYALPAYLAVALGLAAIGLYYWQSGPNLRCSYVGDRGVWLSRRRFRLFWRHRVLCFDDAWDVSARYTRVFRPGYRGTNGRITWVDDENRTVFAIDAGFREYYTDRDEVDFSRLRAHHPVACGRAAILAFHAFVDADNADVERSEAGS
jgi:hypothetical protein